MSELSKNNLPVMETFYTVQGEGFYTGTPAYFIRLGGCDVGCVWCDVKDSWDASAHPLKSVVDLAEAVKSSGAPIAVITGGEPSLYDLSALTFELKQRGIRTHIETSGTNDLTGEWDWVTFSPKKFKVPVDSIYKSADELKVIVFNKTDLEWGAEHATKCAEKTALYFQAEWDRKEMSYPMIMEYITANPKWKISVQTHKYLGVD
jgi:organic radical activating enzyme